jgi:hypothetical protein
MGGLSGHGTSRPCTCFAPYLLNGVKLFQKEKAMSRRIFSISLVIGFLLIASLVLTMTGAQAQGTTVTPVPTSPAEFVGAPRTGASAPLTPHLSRSREIHR